MNARRVLFAMMGLLIAVGGAGYRIGRARADGAPTMQPLYYSGVLEDSGRPVEGIRSVTVRLWDAATAGTTACTTVSPTTAVSAGRFRLALDAACAAAVQANPNLWAEVIVDTSTFPRQKLGAVPYALEAARAAGASGDLARRLTSVEARSDRQIEFGRVGSSQSGCTNSTSISSAFTPLMFTARYSGLYRVTGIANISTNMSSVTGVIFSSPSVSPVLQVQASGNSNGSMAFYANLTAGTSYVFSVNVTVSGSCGSSYPSSYSFSANQPLIAEQM